MPIVPTVLATLFHSPAASRLASGWVSGLGLTPTPLPPGHPAAVVSEPLPRGYPCRGSPSRWRWRSVPGHSPGLFRPLPANRRCLPTQLHQRRIPARHAAISCHQMGPRQSCEIPRVALSDPSLLRRPRGSRGPLLCRRPSAAPGLATVPRSSPSFFQPGHPRRHGASSQVSPAN